MTIEGGHRGCRGRDRRHGLGLSIEVLLQQAGDRQVHLMAVGGAAYLVSKAIREAKIVAFEDLGMEAIHEFVVEDMPVTVAVDVNGTSVHRTGPAEWQARIAKAQPVTVK
jgi:fumarate hydratase class I